MKAKALKSSFAALLVSGSLVLGACSLNQGMPDLIQAETWQEQNTDTPVADVQTDVLTVEEVPPYSGSPYVEINQNEPEFSKDELTENSFEEYSSLDELGRCQTAVASIGTDLMPTKERESISQVKPTGWHSAQYDIVDGGSLYNRCHLIGYQLSGENANEENLITGTRYLNVEGMLPFENMVADYVKETGNHVYYQVTPIFEADNLVASGVQMEAESVEDEGEGICFNVYCYNVQPGIEIDYETGESQLLDYGNALESETKDRAQFKGEETRVYILNTNTHVFHVPSCSSVKRIKEENREEYQGIREKILEEGYTPCGICNP